MFRLWLLTKTDCVASSSTLLSTSSASTTPKLSWYTQKTTYCPPPLLPMNQLKIFSQSTLSSSAECKDEEQQKTDATEKTSNNKGKRKFKTSLAYTNKKKKIEGLMRSIKIRVYSNRKQKEMMKQWMGCSR